ncbi:hypothetical protein VTN02DRAFT_6827 [Thermoascus thermophilus]
MTNVKLGSTAPSPIRSTKISAISPDAKTVPKSRARSQTVGSQDGEFQQSPLRESYIPGHHKRRSQLLDVSPSSSDNEDPRTKALLKVQRRRQSTRRLSQISLIEGPFFRPLDVLICEDHPVSRLVMERLFEKLRCRTITAVNGSEAMRYSLSEVQFDIIMTEFKLPQINGTDVARMVRETRSANRHTPIIAVTGYLKDLPETHHFDSLIEKPPTLAKLTETLCKFCHWKPPPKDYNPSHPLAIPHSALRQPSARAEDSPSSTSSGFPHMPSSYRGSSREDSVGSSYFGDMDSIKPEEVPVIISRHTDDWSAAQGGLGISEDLSTAPGAMEPKFSSAATFPHLLHSTPAHAAISTTNPVTPRKQRSIEGIRARKHSLEKKRYECAESGDDEDEELGHAQVRTHSPHARGPRSGSKLGIEMMRTNSHGSVVSGSEEVLKKEQVIDSQSAENTVEGDEEPRGPSTSTLADKLDKLHIREEALEDESRREGSKPPEVSQPQPEQFFTPQRPSFHQHDTDISPCPSPRTLVEPDSKLQKKGHITPPIFFPKVAGSGATTAESVVTVEGSSADAPGSSYSTDRDSDRPADEDVTPKPAHIPVPPEQNLDSDPTPRPPSRSKPSILHWKKR